MHSFWMLIFYTLYLLAASSQPASQLSAYIASTTMTTDGEICDSHADSLQIIRQQQQQQYARVFLSFFLFLSFIYFIPAHTQNSIGKRSPTAAAAITRKRLRERLYRIDDRSSMTCDALFVCESQYSTCICVIFFSEKSPGAMYD